MSGKGQAITARRKSHRVNPASGVVQELSADCVERQTLTPATGLGTLINTLDKAGKHSCVGVSRAGG